MSLRELQQFEMDKVSGGNGGDDSEPDESYYEEYLEELLEAQDEQERDWDVESNGDGTYTATADDGTSFDIDPEDSAND